MPTELTATHLDHVAQIPWFAFFWMVGGGSVALLMVLWEWWAHVTARGNGRGSKRKRLVQWM